jgi:hypothetical protein
MTPEELRLVERIDGLRDKLMRPTFVFGMAFAKVHDRLVEPVTPMQRGAMKTLLKAAREFEAIIREYADDCTHVWWPDDNHGDEFCIRCSTTRLAGSNLSSHDNLDDPGRTEPAQSTPEQDVVSAWHALSADSREWVRIQRPGLFLAIENLIMSITTKGQQSGDDQGPRRN